MSSAPFVCALTGKETTDAAATPNGYIFDRKTIESHLEFDATCPKTGAAMTKADIIPIKNTTSKGPKKRMIADADTAVIDNSVVPEPIVCFVSAFVAAATSAILSLMLVFRGLDFALLVAVPLFGLIWGVTAALCPSVVASALDLDPSSEALVAVIGALGALAAYGTLRVGLGECGVSKAKVLVLVALLAARAGADCDGLVRHSPAWAVVPLAVAAFTSRGPAMMAYFEANQKAAVKMAAQVREQ